MKFAIFSLTDLHSWKKNIVLKARNIFKIACSVRKENIYTLELNMPFKTVILIDNLDRK